MRDETRTKEQLMDEVEELRSRVARLAEPETTRLSMENEAIARIGRIITSSLDIDQIYERFAEEVTRLIPLDGISIALIDHKESSVRTVYLSGAVISGRTKGSAVPLAGTPTEKVALTRSGLIISMNSREEVQSELPSLLLDYDAGIRSRVVVPLVYQDKVIGGLHIRSFKPDAYSERDLKLAESIGSQIAGAIANAQILEALRKSEEQYRRIVDTTTEGIWTLDESFVITYANKRMAEMLGCDPDDLVGENVSSFTFEDDLPDLLQRLEQRRQGLSDQFERRYRRKDGSELWTLVSSTAMIDEKGRALGSFAMVTDITSRKEAEKKLAHSCELMRYVIENARSCIAVHDRDVKYIYVSQRYLREYGIKDQNVIGKHHYEVFPDLPQKWRDVHQKALAGEVSSADDDPYEREDGSVDWTQWECRPWYEADGSVGGFIVYTEIINERKLKEEALRKSEEQYRRIVETTAEGICVVDQDRTITYVNKRCSEMLGYSLEEMKGANLLSFMFQEDMPDALSRRDRRGPGVSDQFERRFRRKDGSTLWVLASVTSVMDDEGRLLGSFAMYTDITSRKQAEEEKVLLESQLRQSQKMEAIGTLAGGVAHDFNNILMAIIGFASIVQMDLDKADRKYAYIDQILASAKKAANLTQSLLAFSRKQKIDLKPVRINDSIEQTMKILKRLLTEDIELKVNLDDRNPIILADITQIDQILINLATNARDAMPKGGSLLIETGIVNLDDEFVKLHHFGEPGAYALLAVSDVGTGMDEKTKEHIFEPFFTTKEVGKGTGLGLSTVYGIVSQHGGYIALDSALNKGTTFRIYFPIVHSQEREESPTLGEAPRGNETILVAEDDRAVRMMIIDVLHRYGYSTIEAIDGQEALRRFIDNKNGIDLIIFDVVMPKMNGKEVYEEIRRTNPNMRVLFTSGYTRDVVIDRGVEDTMVDFIKKPLLPQDLLRKVREVLDRPGQ